MNSMQRNISKAIRLFCLSNLLGLISLNSSLCQAPIVPKKDPAPPLIPSQSENLLPVTAVMQKWNTIPVVNISINTSLLERVALDTGLDKNVVHPESSERLKLIVSKENVKASFLNSSCEGPSAVIQKMRFSNFAILNTPVAVANMTSFLTTKPHPDAPASWLGTQFFANYQVTFDFIRNVVTLSKPNSPFPKGGDTTVLPLVMMESRPYVKVTLVGSKPFLALLDTGSPGTLLPTEEMEKLKLKPVRVDTITRSDGKPAKAALVIVPKINVGKLEWKSCRAIYLSSDSAPEFDRKFSALGMDFLSRYRVTINYERKQVQFALPILEEKQP